jgi:signal transduction histidine kinase
VTGIFWLDWALIAVSLFNTMLLLWMGLTVLLNANRRDWGVWLMGGGMLVATVFFISHTAILGQELAMNFDGLNFWWRAGWFPVTVAPFAWYVAVLWFSGFWAVSKAVPQSALRRRHRAVLWIMVAWLAALLALLLVANPIPAYDQLVRLDWRRSLAVRGLPLLFLLFPLFTVACILLSIDALRRPAEVRDANTQIARRRALPWVLGTAGTLLAVTVVATGFVGSVIVMGTRGELSTIRIETVAAYDLVLASLIAAATLLLGQAIVAYEIFTGRVLPRRSFVRHWRYAILLAGGYAAVVSWSIALHLRLIYSLLLATLLLTLFYALYVWRAFGEREQFVAGLRPFVQSEGRMPGARQGPTILHGGSAAAIFGALCRDVLGTAHAQLVPLGSVAPLVGEPLWYPLPNESTDRVGGVALGSLSPRSLRELELGMTPLDPGAYSPYRWAISLWDARERIGALLVGDKVDGGLYSQEEMETAQAAGERVVQLLAGEQMLLRLMELQRKRTAEQRVMDQRTRRALHDEILPSLHLAVLQLSGSGQQQARVVEVLRTLAEVHQQIAELLRNTQPLAARVADPCELAGALHSLIDGEFAHSFERVVWRGAAEGTIADPAGGGVYVDPVVGEVILGAAREVMRNAAVHGRGGTAERPLFLEIALEEGGGEDTELALTIVDNGVGIDAGSSNAAAGRSGNGLALHSTLLAMVGGYLTVTSPPAGGTAVRMVAPKG